MNLKENRSAIVRASGIYDALLMIPFAIPGLVGWTLSMIGVVNEALGFPGLLLPIPMIGLMFVNMMACLTIIYAIIRIRRPNWLFGMADIVGRLVMAALLAIYLLLFNVAAVIWFFFVAELGWAVAQYLSLRQISTAEPKEA